MISASWSSESPTSHVRSSYRRSGGRCTSTYDNSPNRSSGALLQLAAVGSGRQFQKARDLAAWLGLVPKEYSTGGKQKLRHQQTG